MKKVAQLSLNDQIFIVKKDFVDERFSDRVWYESTETKIKKLEFDPETNEIVVNKGLEDGCRLQYHEEVYTDANEAKMLAANLNDHELSAEKKIYDDLKKKMENSKKILDFFQIELKKVGQ